jgi:arginase
MTFARGRSLPGKDPQERGPRVRSIVLLDAPSNLGLRPPAPGCVPGCYKLAGALRDQRLLGRLGALEGGVVVPPRYVPDWTPGAGVRNGRAIADYTVRLAGRLAALLEGGRFPVVLGGDCSILLGPALALRRRGRYGLAFLDGHSDFRHLGNAAAVGAAAGEDLALATGRGDRYLTDVDGLGPYVRDGDIALLGVRDGDEGIEELRAAGALVLPAGRCRDGQARDAAYAAVTRLGGPELDGFWIHLDADVLDSRLMPAVDTPEPNGLTFEDLAVILGVLSTSPGAVGLEVTVFDPDLDADGALAARLATCLVEGLRQRSRSLDEPGRLG